VPIRGISIDPRAFILLLRETLSLKSTVIGLIGHEKSRLFFNLTVQHKPHELNAMPSNSIFQLSGPFRW
jgi:hypothetical protein